MMNVGHRGPAGRLPPGVAGRCEQHGAVLIFDEVKCGGTIAYGGATERFGVVPHLAAWAKAIGGGATIGAFGGEAGIMDLVTKGAAQQGTFNGNPLSVGGRAGGAHADPHARCLRPPRQARHDACRGLRRAIEGRGSRPTPWTWARRAASPTARSRCTNYRDFLETMPELYYASYPYMMNRGIFMTPGDEEQWTVSVQHTEDDVQTVRGRVRRVLPGARPR